MTMAHRRCSQDRHLESRLAIAVVKKGFLALDLYDSSCGEGFWVVGYPEREKSVCFAVPRLVLAMEVWRRLKKVGGGVGVS